MDKELSLEFIWLFFPIAGIIGFLLARKHPAFLFLIIPFVFMFAWLHVSEINDPFVGKDIIREAGYSYVVQSYIAISIGTILPFLGVFAWVWRRRKEKLLA
ncbi:MAG: hypothetical protein JWN60_514 [Acidobacteria bacterium]|nr:hypothetical protein [Acidobacteriota bacterium]